MKSNKEKPIKPLRSESPKVEEIDSKNGKEKMLEFIDQLRANIMDDKYEHLKSNIVICASEYKEEEDGYELNYMYISTNAKSLATCLYPLGNNPETRDAVIVALSMTNNDKK